MSSVNQPSIYVAAYAAGVLMFFAPCSVGLLPAYFAYYLSEDDGAGDGLTTGRRASPIVQGVKVAAVAVGALLFLAGAVPLFYMAVAGIRITLPGYSLLVPLAQLGTGSYLPPVVAVLLGTVGLTQGVDVATARRGLRIGVMATLGVVATYLVIAAPVVLLGRWLQPYLSSLELLVGPLLIVLGVLYYRGRSPMRAIPLPERGAASDSRFVAFGVIYGVGSLACNLPVFLGVVLSSFAARGFVAGVAVFVAFALGMGTLMIGVSVLAAASDGAFSPGRYVRATRVVGGLGFLVLGLYVTWFTLVSFGYL